MRKKIFYGVVAILLAYVFITSRVYVKSQTPLLEAESVVVDKANAELSLTSIEDFYLYTKDKTYYSIEAINDENRPVYFSYEPESDYTKVGYADEMVSETDALSIARYNLPDVNVKEARLGIEDDQFIWEVSYFNNDGALGYHYIDAATGQWYETINNL